MIKTIKIQLLPNSKQQTKMFNCANAARFVYNWTLGREIQNYKNGGKFLSDCDLRRELTQLRWLTVGIEEKDCQETPTNEGIGVDLGIKDLAICSDKQVYPNINKTPRVKKIEKKRRRTQRALSRKYEQNKRGEKFVKTKNIEKNKKQLLKVQHKLNNIRHDYLHKTTTEIVRRKPSYICIEDLAVSNMMKNKHLSKAIQQQIWREFRRQIEYKCAWNNIELIIADRFFPSSKLCSVCGEVKKDLKLSDRTYICNCGNVIDRDFNAAINLREYGKFRDTDTLVGNLRLRRVQGPVSNNSESTLDEVGMEHQSL